MQQTKTTALLLIDVQAGFDDPKWGPRNNPDAEQQIDRLLATWRRAGHPVFHVQHNSTNPESPLHPRHPGNAFKTFAAPLVGEPVFEKSVNSAFIGTALESALRAAGVTALVIVGLTTPHCVSTTVRMAGNLGFTTHVISDATAAFAWRSHTGVIIPPEDVHFHSLAVLHGEFATVCTADDLLKILGT